jgi:hypothetical protein
MQIAAGVPIITVAARAGHARASTTSDIYAHFIKSSDKSAAAVIDKVFNPELAEPAAVSPVAGSNPAAQNNTPAIVGEEQPADSVEYFKWAKAEMARLGFETMDEFEEYQAYIDHKKQKRAQKNSDSCM